MDINLKLYDRIVDHMTDVRLYEEGDYKISSETGVDGNTQIDGIDLQEKDITVVFDICLENKKIWLHPLQNDNTVVIDINWVITFLKSIDISYDFLEL